MDILNLFGYLLAKIVYFLLKMKYLNMVYINCITVCFETSNYCGKT